MNNKVRLLEIAAPILLITVATSIFLYVSRASSDINSRYNTLSSISLPTKAKPISIAAVGDIACDAAGSSSPGECQQQKTADLVLQKNPDAVLALGDLQYQNGAFDKFKSGFDLSWGKLKPKTYPTPGNHEYETKDAVGYYTYFSDGESAITASDITRGYYSFNLGGWHFISLNSNCNKTNDCSENSTQIQWLKSDLQKNKLSCTMAFWHHPRFTSGYYYGDKDTAGRSDEFWKILKTYNAEVVLNGHDHIYERFASQDSTGELLADGIRQFTVGTGGRSLYTVKQTAKNSEKIVSDNYGVLFIKLYLGSYQWQFVSAGGEVLDKGRNECNE